jgi:hypothetical protein|tara:strand:- start:312 stop:758 length:447 start_codon:yes stop_codon:yes gene_type:complete
MGMKDESILEKPSTIAVPYIHVGGNFTLDDVQNAEVNFSGDSLPTAMVGSGPLVVINNSGQVPIIRKEKDAVELGSFMPHWREHVGDLAYHLLEEDEDGQHLHTDLRALVAIARKDYLLNALREIGYDPALLSTDFFEVSSTRYRGRQ